VGSLAAAAPELTIVDLAGLNDNALAREGFSAAYVLSRRPDLIWLPHPDYTGMLRSLLASPELSAHYELYPGAFDYGIAVLRDGPRREDVMRTLEAVWSETYPGVDMTSHQQ
jgi:hypothetical protein